MGEIPSNDVAMVGAVTMITLLGPSGQKYNADFILDILGGKLLTWPKTASHKTSRNHREEKDAFWRRIEGIHAVPGGMDGGAQAPGPQT